MLLFFPVDMLIKKIKICSAVNVVIIINKYNKNHSHKVSSETI